MINYSTEMQCSMFSFDQPLTVSQWKLDDEDKENSQVAFNKRLEISRQSLQLDSTIGIPTNEKSKELRRIIETSFRRRPNKQYNLEEFVKRCNTRKF